MARTFTPIQIREDAIKLSLGERTVAFVQPNEYNGVKSVSLLQSGPRSGENPDTPTGYNIKSGIGVITPDIMGALLFQYARTQPEVTAALMVQAAKIISGEAVEAPVVTPAPARKTTRGRK